MTPTQKGRRSDALYMDTRTTHRRQLCDMVVNREADIEDLKEEIYGLQCDIGRLEAENAKLQELVRYNGAIIEACTGEILDHIGVPYIVGPAGVAQALMEATAMLVHKRYDFDPPSFYKEDE